MILSALLPLALATSGFNATAPATTFTGSETYNQDASIQLWSAIERIQDPDRTLFHQEAFNDSTAWPATSDYAPWIADCFGTPTPASWLALLHIGPSDAAAHGTPILFVPGAGDNGSRGFITMATHMDRLFRPVYVITFAHPHGDVFIQAEMIADAIARIKERTGAAQVDVVSHSKGGLATAVYLSNLPGTRWPDQDYMNVGTTYRGDVRKAVFIATPLGGIDTSYRWPNANMLSTDADTAIAPTSWSSYGFTSLEDQDFLPDGEDLFPGHRQLLARQTDYPLPGEQSWLGVYSLQTDWYTTYEGGYGFSSYSTGIDDAITAGGDLIDVLHQTGVDPSIELFLLAGTNPLMPNGTMQYLSNVFDAAWVDLANSSMNTWGTFLSLIVGNSLETFNYTQSEVQGLASGALILGEITGESDGLVFTTSATDAEALTARGASVSAIRTANLSHLDLLYASPITGGLLEDAAAADTVNNGWMQSVGERYVTEDTIGQVEDWLADPESPDTGDTGHDSDPTTDSDPTQDDSGSGQKDSDIGGYNEDDDGRDAGTCGCANGGSPTALPVMFGLLFLARRRKTPAQ